MESVAEQKTPQCIADFFASAEKAAERVRALAPHAEIAHQVAEAFPALKPRVCVIDWGYFGGAFVALQVDVSKFEDVVPAMRMLAALGYRTDKNKPFEDYHEIDRRTYNLGEAPAHPLRVMAFLRAKDENGPTCRRVQVGVREEPVYEFVCDDAPALAEVSR